MSAWQSNRRGTLMIDLRLRRVGRLLKASGTQDPGQLADMKAAFRLLAKRDGGRDILRAIQAGRLTPLEVYERFVRGQLVEVPTPQSLMPLTRFKDWAERTATGPDNRAARILAARRLLELAGAQASIPDLSVVLRTYRDRCERDGHHEAFRLVREAARAFARDLEGRYSPLWTAVAAVQPFPRGKPTRRPMSLAQFRAAAQKLEPDDAGIAWAMAVTGMGKREYWETPWEELADRVLIHGTKRAGRERAVPRVMTLALPAHPYAVFRLAWHAAAEGRTPRDLRRTYARWLQEAKIPRTRRRLYYGHGAKDVSDLYEQMEVTEFLRADGTRLRRFLGLQAQRQQGRRQA